MKEADLWHQAGFTVAYRYFPTITRWYFTRQPEARVEVTDEKRLQLGRQNVSNGAKSMPEKDLKIYKDDDVLRLSATDSGKLLAWGFMQWWKRAR